MFDTVYKPSLYALIGSILIALVSQLLGNSVLALIFVAIGIASLAVTAIMTRKQEQAIAEFPEFTSSKKSKKKGFELHDLDEAEESEQELALYEKAKEVVDSEVPLEDVYFHKEKFFDKVKKVIPGKKKETSEAEENLNELTDRGMSSAEGSSATKNLHSLSMGEGSSPRSGSVPGGLFKNKKPDSSSEEDVWVPGVELNKTRKKSPFKRKKTYSDKEKTSSTESVVADSVELEHEFNGQHDRDSNIDDSIEANIIDTGGKLGIFKSDKNSMNIPHGPDKTMDPYPSSEDDSDMPAWLQELKSGAGEDKSEVAYTETHGGGGDAVIADVEGLNGESFGSSIVDVEVHEVPETEEGDIRENSEPLLGETFAAEDLISEEVASDLEEGSHSDAEHVVENKSETVEALFEKLRTQNFSPPFTRSTSTPSSQNGTLSVGNVDLSESLNGDGDVDVEVVESIDSDELFEGVSSETAESEVEEEIHFQDENEPVESDIVESELVENEPVENEPVESDIVESELVENEPVENEPVENEPVESDSLTDEEYEHYEPKLAMFAEAEATGNGSENIGEEIFMHEQLSSKDDDTEEALGQDSKIGDGALQVAEPAGESVPVVVTKPEVATIANQIASLLAEAESNAQKALEKRIQEIEMKAEEERKQLEKNWEKVVEGIKREALEERKALEAKSDEEKAELLKDKEVALAEVNEKELALHKASKQNENLTESLDEAEENLQKVIEAQAQVAEAATMSTKLQAVSKLRKIRQESELKDAPDEVIEMLDNFINEFRK